MTDKIIITGQATIACSCGNDELTMKVEGIELHDLTDHLEKRAEEDHGWGSCGHCPECQAGLDEDVAEVEKADAQRREELVA